MFEPPVGTGERALLVHIDFPQAAQAKKIQQNEAQSEFYDLVMSAGAEPLSFIKGKRHKVEAKYFIGTGKAQEIKEAVQTLDADLVIVNHQLSPSQERNLEALLECRVIDRTGLILDIFAQRARSHEGKLQVELAQLRYMTTRLVRGWTHLERQKGGLVRVKHSWKLIVVYLMYALNNSTSAWIKCASSVNRVVVHVNEPNYPLFHCLDILMQASQDCLIN